MNWDIQEETFMISPNGRLEGPKGSHEGGWANR